MIEDPSYAELLKVNSEQMSDKGFKLNYGLSSNYKMVIIVREDLQLSKGKTAAQVGHAVLGAYKKGIAYQPVIVQNWEEIGQAKIVLSVPNEKDLLELMNKAEFTGLITCTIRDAGKTEIAPNTVTCCAIGPGTVEAIDTITGHLKLL